MTYLILTTAHEMLIVTILFIDKEAKMVRGLSNLSVIRQLVSDRP